MAPVGRALAFVAIWVGAGVARGPPGAVFKATGRSWLLTRTGVRRSPSCSRDRLAANHGIAAVAAAQVVEKTISLAMLGVFVGRVLRIPWYTTFTTAAPLLVPWVGWPCLVYVLGLVLEPFLTLARKPIGSGIYVFLLHTFTPDCTAPGRTAPPLLEDTDPDRRRAGGRK